MATIELSTKRIGDITGTFEIPTYQRGYRWKEKDVIRLLCDIEQNQTKPYCLQPIVVKRIDKDRYELIDGQQRLTTIFLIYKYMYIESNGWNHEALFKITYASRPESEMFLSNICPDQKEKYIDFWFMYNAYQAIKDWFDKKETKKKSTVDNFNKYFDENVRIIWYEVDQNEDAIELYRNLNVGKISLTDAELVKAMFLSSVTADDLSVDNDALKVERQDEIALQWDSMEQQLNKKDFWFFLSGRNGKTYSTHIEIILDLIADKQAGEKDKYYTFFYFDNLRQQGKNLKSIWEDDIQRTFLLLTDWFENNDLYHKIGYLISSGFLSLQDVHKLAKEKTKKDFLKDLDQKIKESISLSSTKKHNYGELRYMNDDGKEIAVDKVKLQNLLLLFNVVTSKKTQRFPFDKYNNQDENIHWSLEHIHAQKSKMLQSQEDQKEWLEYHIESLKSLENSYNNEQDIAILHELLKDIENAQQKSNLRQDEFSALQDRVLDLLSAKVNTSTHSIANLALLNTSDNAALNNSAFDAKRIKIIEMDKDGRFIPICTRNVFLKYYSTNDNNQLHFWGDADRKAYIEEINRVLGEYLDEPIFLNKEEA